MAKVWNPGAKRETVAEFLQEWCVRGAGSWSRPDALFGAYEIYCRAYGKKDLTLGEFNDELEQLGFHLEPRYGTPMWHGVTLAVLEDSIARRGLRPRGKW